VDARRYFEALVVRSPTSVDPSIAFALIAALSDIPADALSDYEIMSPSANPISTERLIAAITGALPAAIGANAVARG
jgi:magnesium chelatase family protein